MSLSPRIDRRLKKEFKSMFCFFSISIGGCKFQAQNVLLDEIRLHISVVESAHNRCVTKLQMEAEKFQELGYIWR